MDASERIAGAHEHMDLAAGYRWIYAIIRDDTREVKIGISTDPLRRLEQIQQHHGSGLRLALVMVGGRDEERKAHAKFRDSHLVGEWFRLSPEIEKWIIKSQKRMRHVHEQFPDFNNIPSRQAERRFMGYLDEINGRMEDA